MTARSVERLVLVGSAIVDLVMYVDELPPAGGDVVAKSSMSAVGGGFNVLAAAARAGLPAAYGGLTGGGPFGLRVRDALEREGVELLLGEPATLDTGFCVALVDRAGERTFVTTVGAEGRLDAELLAGLSIGDGDAVYLSGYDLVYPHAEALTAWVCERRPRMVVLDPGPLVADIDAELLDQVFGCLSWLSLNVREGVLLTSHADIPAIARAVFDRVPSLDGVVIRDGASGCDVFWSPEEGQHVPAPAVQAVDSNGAGDVHVATFVAALARGENPVAAARAANDAAASAVTVFGPGAGAV